MLLQELLDQYYVYIPENLSSEISKLHFQCMMLVNAQTNDAAGACIEPLLNLQENIRKYIQRIPRVKETR